MKSLFALKLLFLFQGWVLFEVVIDTRRRAAVGGSKVGAPILVCDLL